MRPSILFILLFFSVIVAKAQVSSEAEHKIIFQLTEGSAESHTKFIRQINNVLVAAPNSKIEVVTHGMGVDLLVKDNNIFTKDLGNLVDRGVDFVVCENTLKQRNLKKEQFLSLVSFVPSAILELVIKQEQGWIYIKAGG